MPFIITNGKAYCHKTRTQAVEIVDDIASATRFSSRNSAEKLLARATKKLKGFTVEELQDTVSKDPLPAGETEKHDARPKRGSRTRTRKRPSEQEAEAANPSGTGASPEEADSAEHNPDHTDKKPEPKESQKTENVSAEPGKTTSEKKPAKRGRKSAARKTSSPAPMTDDVPKTDAAPQTADEQKKEAAPQTADGRKKDAAPQTADKRKKEAAPQTADDRKKDAAPQTAGERKTEPASQAADVPKKKEPSAAPARSRKVKTFLNVQDASAHLWEDEKTQQPLSGQEPKENDSEPAGKPEKKRVFEPAGKPEKDNASEPAGKPEKDIASEPAGKPEKDNTSEDSGKSGQPVLKQTVSETSEPEIRQENTGGRRRNGANRRRRNAQAASSAPAAGPDTSSRTDSAEVPSSAEDIVFQPVEGKKPEQSRQHTGQINGTGKVRTNRRKIGKVAENIRSVKNTEDTSSKRRFFTTKERNLIYNRSEGHCGICGRFIPLEEYTIDHIIPLSKGGTNDLDNLQACCSFCNKAKDDSMGDDFFTRIERIFLYQAKLRYGKKQYKVLKRTIKELETEE